MKKYLCITILILLITGCGNQKLKCTKEEKNNNSTIKYTINANIDTGKIESATETIEFTDEKTATEYCNILKITNSFSNKDSFNYDCEGKEIKIRDFLAIEGINKNITRTEFIEKLENEQFTCN